MKTVKDLILGGGLTGRMLNRHIKNSIVLEAKDKDDHSYRYGTNYLWKPVPGFDLRPVKIYTLVDGMPATDESIRRYKNKIGKGDEKASEWGLQFLPETRGWVICGMEDGDILYGKSVKSIYTSKKIVCTDHEEYQYENLYVTIPLNSFLRLSDWRYHYPLETIFKFKPVYVHVSYITETLRGESNTFEVNYVSDPLVDYYRKCFKSSTAEIHYESLIPLEHAVKVICPGKIWWDPYIETITTNLKKENVTCWGRYGAWRPNELVHETYERIQEWKA